MRYPEDLNPAGLDAEGAARGAWTPRASTSPCSTAGLGQALGGIQRRRARGRVPPGVERLDRGVGSTASRSAVGHGGDSAARSRRRRARGASAPHGMGLDAGVIRPNPVHGVPLWSPRLRPDVRSARGHRACRSGLHGAGMFDMDGRQQAHGRPDGVGHAPRAHPLHGPVPDALGPGVRRRARAASRRCKVPCSSAAAAGSRTGWIASTSSSTAYEWAAGAAVAHAERVLPAPVRRSASIRASARWARWPTSRARTTSSGRPTSRTPTRSTRVSSTSSCEHTDDAARTSGSARSRRERRAALRHRGPSTPLKRVHRRCLSSTCRPRRHRRRRQRRCPRTPPTSPCATAASPRSAASTTPRARTDRRRRVRRRARLRRHPHALRRAAALGADRVAVVVARRHDRDHRQLRLLARSRRGPTTSPGCCDMLSRVEGMRRRRSPRASPSPVAAYADFAAGLDGRHRRERRAPGRPLAPASLRHGRRRRDPRPRPPTRSPRWPTLVRDALRRGAVGFSSSQLDMHVDHARQPGAVEPRRARRARRAGGGARRVRARRDRVHLPHATSKGIDDADRALMLGDVRGVAASR